MEEEKESLEVAPDAADAAATSALGNSVNAVGQVNAVGGLIHRKWLLLGTEKVAEGSTELMPEDSEKAGGGNLVATERNAEESQGEGHGTHDDKKGSKRKADEVSDFYFY